MKCPFCNKEMEEGVIQSPYELAWKKKKSFLTGTSFDKDAISLSEPSFLKGSSVNACLCRECKKIIIEY